MINLNLTEAQLDELHQEVSDNPGSRARRKGWIVYLRGKGHACQEIVDRMWVDGNTVTEYLRKYGAGGLPQLLAEGYRRPGGCLDSPAEQLKALFGKQPSTR